VGRRPLSAFRVGRSVFYLSGKGKAKWRRRAWQEKDDALMTLPYQRKYDHERHGRADEQLRFHQEALRIALDFLELLHERVTDPDVSDGSFSWPELADIQAELERLDLGLGIDELLSFGRSFDLQLAALSPEPTGQKRLCSRVKFTIEEGAYWGVLGGYHRRPSGALRQPLSAASLKWILLQALAELTERLQAAAAKRAAFANCADGCGSVGRQYARP
jgi:hypothetical protein